MGSFPLVRSKQGEDCSDFRKLLVSFRRHHGSHIAEAWLGEF